MTLASIMKLAMKQLDEAAEDMAEYEELFRSYANMGYMIALRQYYKPRETFILTTDKAGRAPIGALALRRVVSVWDARGAEIGFAITTDGEALVTAKREETLHVLCEVERETLKKDTDEPKMPEYAHAALADYICYRHLSSGSLSKQSRAEFFRNSFYQQMQALRYAGEGSVRSMKNLYAATDIAPGRCAP